MTLVRWSDRNLFPSSTTMFDKFFTDEDQFFKAISQGTSVPAVNVSESKSSFEVEVAVPGKSKEDFKVEVENNVLSISSENEEETESREKNYTRKEYSYSSFRRQFTLPENVMQESINANYENGVLQISIPKKELVSTTAKSISVE